MTQETQTAASSAEATSVADLRRRGRSPAVSQRVSFSCRGSGYGLACALPSAPICNLFFWDAGIPPDDGSLPIIDGGEPYPVVDGGGTPSRTPSH